MSYFDDIRREAADRYDLDYANVQFGVLASVWRDQHNEAIFGVTDTPDDSWELISGLQQTNLAIYEGDNVWFYVGLVDTINERPIYWWDSLLSKSWYVDHKVEIELRGIDQGLITDSGRWAPGYAFNGDDRAFTDYSQNLQSVNGLDHYILEQTEHSLYDWELNDYYFGYFSFISEYETDYPDREDVDNDNTQQTQETVYIDVTWENPFFNLSGEFTIPSLDNGGDSTFGSTATGGTTDSGTNDFNSDGVTPGTTGDINVTFDDITLGNGSYDEITIGEGERDGVQSIGVSAAFNYIDLPDDVYSPAPIPNKPAPELSDDYFVVPEYQYFEARPNYSIPLNVLANDPGVDLASGNFELVAGYYGAPDIAAAAFGDVTVKNGMLYYRPTAEFADINFDYITYHVIDEFGQYTSGSAELTTFATLVSGYGSFDLDENKDYSHPEFGEPGYDEALLNERFTGTEQRDYIDGGYGNDTIDGSGGNDWLYGGEGDDLVYGSFGNDWLIGEAAESDPTFFVPGNDTLSGGPGEDTAFFWDPISAVTIERDGDNLRITSPSDGVDIVTSSVETIAFNGLDYDYYYNKVYDEYTFEELYWPEGRPTAPTPPTETVRVYGDGDGGRILASSIDDYVYGDGLRATYFQDDANAVYRLYQATLNREPDRGGHEGFTTRVAMNDISLVEIAGQFTQSQEFQTRYGSLDDRGFVSLLYQNVLGREADSAGLNGWVSQLSSGVTREQVVLGFSESSEFRQATNAEATRFAQDSDPALWADDVFRLYQATLNRTPDMTGFLGWTELLADGTPLLTAINGFVASQEFENTYGALGNEAFVELLYNNVLGRASDAAGLNGWLEAMSGGATRSEVVYGFAQSQEFVNATFDDLTAWVRAQGDHDVIAGAGGNDRIYGGMLTDVFLFSPEVKGRTVIADLEAWDDIDLRAFGYQSEAAARAMFSSTPEGLTFEDRGVEIVVQTLPGASGGPFDASTVPILWDTSLTGTDTF